MKLIEGTEGEEWRDEANSNTRRGNCGERESWGKMRLRGIRGKLWTLAAITLRAVIVTTGLEWNQWRVDSLGHSKRDSEEGGK